MTIRTIQYQKCAGIFELIDRLDVLGVSANAFMSRDSAQKFLDFITVQVWHSDLERCHRVIVDLGHPATEMRLDEVCDLLERIADAAETVMLTGRIVEDVSKLTDRDGFTKEEQ